MPRPGPRRVPFTVKLKPAAADWLHTEAKRRGTSRSELIRQALAREQRFTRRP